MHFFKKTIYNDTFNNDTVYSDSISLQQIYGYSVQAQYSGTSIAGSLTLQASNDGTTFFDLSTSQSITSTGDVFWNITDSFYAYFRVKIVSSNGNDMTVTLTAYGKGV